MATITQDMGFRLSLIKYADKYEVTKAAVKYKTNRQYVYRWKRRYNGSIESLRGLSRRPHHHPNQHTLFQVRLEQHGIRHKVIRPYTPRHNGKVERSHRKDNERFYATHRFYSFEDFAKQLKVYNRRDYNAFPMRPLGWKSPNQVLRDYLRSV